MTAASCIYEYRMSVKGESMFNAAIIRGLILITVVRKIRFDYSSRSFDTHRINEIWWMRCWETATALQRTNR